MYVDKNTLCFNEDSGNVLFICNGTCILSIYLLNTDVDSNFDKDDLDTVIFIRLLAWHIKFENAKNLKKC